ncbi:hypothetical protein C7B82_10215 [Stenomitos frigidus ULC18]|uniref:Uncharacterized protein n=1 Tax=Stenomitos frigidus ULC18 TaxID=2107698 RepID=A0A2T1EB27_9CYAN|nr:hypothetical protein C7B82_10215 [Stenomitos frigidus ULC18]
MALVPDLIKLWEFGHSLGLQPELTVIQYHDRVEVHLLLLHEQLEPGTVLGFEWNALIERLLEVDVPDEAIRHTYGGQMAREAA